MRKVRDALRLSWGEQLSLRQVARSLAMPHTTVAVFLRRAKEAGLTWPLPDDLDDDALERRLFGTASAPSSSHAAPDFAA
jgi:DNA-binding transcriptional regulator LsrR (DeoR family)